MADPEKQKKLEETIREIGRRLVYDIRQVIIALGGFARWARGHYKEYKEAGFPYGDNAQGLSRWRREHETRFKLKGDMLRELDQWIDEVGVIGRET